jgi:hypothetical protein
MNILEILGDGVVGRRSGHRDRCELQGNTAMLWRIQTYHPGSSIMQRPIPPHPAHYQNHINPMPV